MSSDTRFKSGQSGNPGGMSKEQRAKQVAIRDAALENCPEALAEAVRLLKSHDERVRLGAIKEIFDRGLGKPAQAIIATGDEDGGPVKHSHVVEWVSGPASTAK